MKRTLALLAVAFSTFGLAQNVLIEDRQVTFDAPPKMVNGTYMVPVRNMFDAIGVDMRWRTDRDVLEGLYKGNKVEIWVGSKMARLNDQRQDLDAAPFEERGRIYAPLKFLAQSFKYTISTENGNLVLRSTVK
jgi:hypothetical protein